MEEVEAHPELRADELIAYTINQVAESINNILLIIDDVHFINSSEIHKALETLIEHLPSNLRLILAGLPVYVFNGTTYTGKSGTTNASGEVSLDLPEGSYHFRSNFNGQQYFSAATNTCTVPACTTSQITEAVFGLVTVTVTDDAGTLQPDLPVYAFKGSTYTGLSGVTGADGKVTLWIPAGSYRFRADQFELQFFSGETNLCSVPECTTASVSTLGMQQVVTEQTIDSTYDPRKPANLYSLLAQIEGQYDYLTLIRMSANIYLQRSF